ncbi:hypothetical protein VPH526E571_0007 [Vibrio phage 526E57-1]
MGLALCWPHRPIQSPRIPPCTRLHTRLCARLFSSPIHTPDRIVIG